MPLLNQHWRRRNEPTVLCAHPYDLAAALIAQKAGVPIFDQHGANWDGPTELTAEIGWIGFSNPGLASRYLPGLLQIIQQNNWRS